MSRVKITFNRHLFIVVACLVLVFTAGVLSNKAWHSQVVQGQVTTAKQRAVDADKKRRQAATVAAEKAQLKAECNKEVAYYNSLTAVQKKGKDTPACVALTANY